VSVRALVSCVQMQAEIDAFRDVLAQNGIDVELPTVVQQLDEAQLLEIIGDFEGVIAGDDHFTARVLQQGMRLRIVSKWGVGRDNIDLVEAARLGIKVTNTPGTLSDEVADVCVGYLIMLARQLHLVDRGVRRGEWPKPRGVSLGEKTLGIVGLGEIGRALARRALSMGMLVLGHDLRPQQCEIAERMGVGVTELKELLAESDFVSLNCPLTLDNRRMIDDEALALMRPGAHLVNTARGGLVDQAALIEALEAGQLAGAALDVFEIEPLPQDSPLRDMDQVILGSHNSSNTRQANYRASEVAVRNLIVGLGRQA
jgi:D-3-phosphoglycerate dehydrogenase